VTPRVLRGAALVEDREPQPREVRPEADAPHDAADVGRVEGELARLRRGAPHGDVARFPGCRHGGRRDVAVDRIVDPLADRVGAVEIARQIVIKREPSVREIQEPAVERHAVQRESAQIEIVAARASRDVVVRVLADARAERVLLDRHLVVAHFVEPRDHVPAAIAPRDARRIADAEPHAPAGEVQVLGDLSAGLARAHDEHLARRELFGIAVVLRMELQQPLREQPGERRDDRRVIAADGCDHRPRAVRSAARVELERSARPGAHVVHGDALAQRRRERCGEPLEIRDDLVACHEAVGIVARVRIARQATLPVRRDEAERIPALVTLRVPDAVAFEDDVLDPTVGELAREREPGLARADDRDRRIRNVHADEVP